jgi:hypothetical protein
MIFTRRVGRAATERIQTPPRHHQQTAATHHVCSRPVSWSSARIRLLVGRLKRRSVSEPPTNASVMPFGPSNVIDRRRSAGDTVDVVRLRAAQQLAVNVEGVGVRCRVADDKSECPTLECISRQRIMARSRLSDCRRIRRVVVNFGGVRVSKIDRATKRRSCPQVACTEAPLLNNSTPTRAWLLRSAEC